MAVAEHLQTQLNRATKKINSVLLMHGRVRGFTKKREIKHKIILISYHLILQVQDVTGKE